MWCTWSGSATIFPTEWRGLSDANGSWKTICIRRRSGCSWFAERRDVLTVEQDPAARRLEEPEHRPPDRRLAAAGLADETERLAARDPQAHAVDGLDVADVPVEDDPAT